MDIGDGLSLYAAIVQGIGKHHGWGKSTSTALPQCASGLTGVKLHDPAEQARDITICLLS